MDDHGKLVNEDQEMGELLNRFFASVFTKENNDNLPTVNNVFQGEDNHKLCSFNITSEVVKTKLTKLKMNKAPGIDKIGTRMLTEVSEVMCNAVAELFNKSLSSGDIPEDWKLANVTAVFKKGKKD